MGAFRVLNYYHEPTKMTTTRIPAEEAAEEAAAEECAPQWHLWTLNRLPKPTRPRIVWTIEI